ncbi:hypothetical protein CEXT_675411 [Caerostris extrusa]|uniref:Uncharacterized protein n=1 Tax=Caerostris extrusa TaxID=172846 RepID=A0AAV4SYD6_CAEEX|nr:hypothetical protein CEXT_675411 [Caerostris extrusa]
MSIILEKEYQNENCQNLPIVFGEKHQNFAFTCAAYVVKLQNRSSQSGFPRTSSGNWEPGSEPSVVTPPIYRKQEPELGPQCHPLCSDLMLDAGCASHKTEYELVNS